MSKATTRLRKQRSFQSMVGSEGGARSHLVLLSYDEIPAWHQDNEFILTGYRCESHSVRESLRSWTYVHNETFNIYSHLLPAFAALVSEGLAYRCFQLRYPEATAGDRTVLALFLLAIALCLGMSAAYHTLMNHSQAVSGLWLRLDFAGIIVLTMAYFVSGIYVGFYCEPTLQKIYWTMICTLCILTAFILLNPKFQGRRYRTFRLGTFIGTGLSAFAPIIHGVSIFGWTQMNKQSGLPFYLSEGVILIFGAWIYNARIPESLKPGRFDIWGSSHQIFHALVVVATAVHLTGIAHAYEYNYQTKRCAV